MQFELPLGPWRRGSTFPGEDWLRVGANRVHLRLAVNRRARRYVLRLLPGGVARVTIPRGGSAAEARRFAERNVGWLERQLLRQATRREVPKSWLAGTEILFRGERVRLEPGVNGEAGSICFGGEIVPVASAGGDVRPHVERHLWRLAARELPGRVLELAGLHQLPVRRVSVRNQRTRWGSCSRRGTVSLNWRLVQAPPFVRDYLILHELAHLREMNHSRRFWREVAALCPDYLQAERWLKAHRELL
jgi:predicted metal-dependent hydrolase